VNARHRAQATINVMAALRQVLVMVVIPVVFGYLVGTLVLAGCGASLEEIDRASGDVADKLQKCRGEARADFYVGKKSVEESLRTYETCKKREGL
jgi:outer membrane murein-binding lipoprotein Lpp